MTITDPIIITNGIFVTIYVAISLIIGGKMIATYFKTKEQLLLLVGLTWIGIVSPWYPAVISFFVAFFNDVGIDPVAYYIIGNVSAPAILIIWMYAFTEFFYKNRRKILLGAAIIYSIAFEIIFFVLLAMGPEFIANFNAPIDVEYKGIFMIVAASVIIIMTTTGIIFSYKSIVVFDPETKLKGYFLLVAFISYAIGAFLDAAVEGGGYFLLIITRLILISSAIEWYCGFMLPDWVKRLFIKED
mgnify:CR=1 FL=1